MADPGARILNPGSRIPDHKLSYFCIMMKKMKYSFGLKAAVAWLTVICICLLAAESNAQVFQDAMKIINQGSVGLSEKDAADGIREALVKGTGESVTLVSAVNGYFSNPQIRIPFPEQAKTIESKLRAIGMGSKVDEAVLAINRAAEDAAKSAQPIFVSAITGMNISDALKIVQGPGDAATAYLKKTTTPQLRAKFSPVIKAALDQADATQLWAQLITVYNQIPFVSRQDPDLTAYVTDKAIAGLFTMIAKEEMKIRQNPQARTTELLQKVFGH